MRRPLQGPGVVGGMVRVANNALPSHRPHMVCGSLRSPLAIQSPSNRRQAPQILTSLSPLWCRSAAAAAPEECAAKKEGKALTLAADASTVHWGYFYDGIEPNLVASSGDTV